MLPIKQILCIIVAFAACLTQAANANLNHATNMNEASSVERPKLAQVKRAHNFKDLSGQRFGRLVVIRQNGRTNQGQSMWECHCDCGNSTIVFVGNLKRGNTKSCGCLHSEIAENRFLVHGEGRAGMTSREFTSWVQMRGRCSNKANPSFRNYGGRGIRVCREWGDFTAFLNDMGRCPHGMTLDRRDVNGDYAPWNCRWATISTQNNNKRNNRLITFNGKTQTIAEWADEFGWAYSKLYARIVTLGWDVERALSNNATAVAIEGIKSETAVKTFVPP